MPDLGRDDRIAALPRVAPVLQPCGRLDVPWLQRAFGIRGRVVVCIFPPSLPAVDRLWVSLYSTIIRSSWWTPLTAVLYTLLGVLSSSFVIAFGGTALVMVALLLLLRRRAQRGLLASAQLSADATDACRVGELLQVWEALRSLESIREPREFEAAWQRLYDAHRPGAGS